MDENVLIFGTGGHAKVVADCILSKGDRVLGFVDDNRSVGEIFYGSAVIGQMEDVERLVSEYEKVSFIIALGDNRERMKIAKQYPALPYYTAIHSSAQISPTARIGKGTVVMPCAVVNAQSEIGNHCIINTSCVLEHDNQIEDFVNISPQVATGGQVKIGAGTFVGIGVSIINDVAVCGESFLGAGCVVTGNINTPGTYVGIPAKLQKKMSD